MILLRISLGLVVDRFEMRAKTKPLGGLDRMHALEVERLDLEPLNVRASNPKRVEVTRFSFLQRFFRQYHAAGLRRIRSLSRWAVLFADLITDFPSAFVPSPTNSHVREKR
jgi:hypothetical protein